MASVQAALPRPVIETRILTPENCKMFMGEFSLLHAHITPDDDGPGLYRAIHAVRTFPISSPDQYISLLCPDEHGVEQEIGVIVDLAIFPEESQILVRESLSRHYFEHTIERIYRVQWKYNLLFFDVETSHGRVEFQMRWQVDRALDHGTQGKVLMDIYDNRYLLPDIQVLPRVERERFLRFIYW